MTDRTVNRRAMTEHSVTDNNATDNGIADSSVNEPFVQDTHTTELTPHALLGLLKATLQAWLADRAPTMGAALAYYTLFSLAPLLLIAISLAGALFGVQAARAEILGQLHDLLGNDGAEAVAGLLRSVQRNDQSVSGTLIGGGSGCSFGGGSSILGRSCFGSTGTWGSLPFGVTLGNINLLR